MRINLAALVLLAASTFASAQPAKTPEHLLPADCVAYFRYDGYAAHQKAYDRTALAKVMKEGTGEFLDHLFSQLVTLVGDDVPPRELKKGEGRRLAADRFLEYLWGHGVAATFEFAPGNEKAKTEDLVQLTIVFPQGAAKKNREAIDNVLQMGLTAIGAQIENAEHGGRAMKVSSFDEVQAAWWPEGEHLMLTVGTQPAQRALRVLDGRRPNLTAAKWHKELTGFKQYETDMRGYIDLETIIDRVASIGLKEPGLNNLKDRFARHVVLRHLGLTGLKDLTVHLGFDGKYQRSTVRLGVVEPELRPGLLRLMSGPIAFDERKLPPLPPDADYVSVRHVDWEAVYEYLRSSYSLFAFAQLFDGKLPEDHFPDLDKILGINFRKDLLQQLDTTVVTWGAHSEGPFFLGQGFAIKVKDAAKVRKSLEAIGKKAGELEEKLTPEKRTYRGHELYILNKLPIPVTYALHDDWLLVGLFPQPVQGVLMRSGGKYRVWKAPPETAAAFGKQNGKSQLIAMSVSDPRPAIEIGLALMPVFVQTVNASAGFKAIDITTIPNAQSINEWLFPNVMLSYDDGNALRWENFYSINEPDDLLLLQFAGYAAPYRDLLRLRGRARAKAPELVAPERAKLPKGELLAPPDRADLPKQPTFATATAAEANGVVTIAYTMSRPVPYTITRKVPETVAQEIVVDGQKKTVYKVVYRTVTETAEKNVQQTGMLIADSKKVTVTRQDGKVVEPKELPALLRAPTRVLLVREGVIPPDMLKDAGERTLIVRIAP